MAIMKTLVTEKLTLSFDETQLGNLNALFEKQARVALAKMWHTEVEDLLHYLALFTNKKIATLDDNSSFITLSFNAHGYVLDPELPISIGEAQKQIEIDLEIINRESQWSAEDSIYFSEWWPKPSFDPQTHTLEFGVALRDFYKRVINRTINRVILTRYGHISLNYSLSEADTNAARPLSYYQKQFDDVVKALTISPEYSYDAVNEDSDTPSKSRLINLILSSEIF